MKPGQGSPDKLRRIRLVLVFFAVALVLSGLTAFPLEWEVNLLAKMCGAADASTPEQYTGWLHWLVKVRNGLGATYADYPFMAYGTDWLAFSHLIIAVFFVGAIRDPVRNVWVIQAGMIACGLVIPLALICGPLRGIPFYWRLIDCLFGVIGIVPLWLAWRWIRELAFPG